MGIIVTPAVPSILDTIMAVESGGKNVTQGNIGDVNNATGDLAQGYFQITNSTWSDFGGLATGYASAIAAPFNVQLQVAKNIPVSRWGPNTQAALITNGYHAMPGETLGGLLSTYGDTGQTNLVPVNATVDGLVGGAAGIFNSIFGSDPIAATASEIGGSDPSVPTDHSLVNIPQPAATNILQVIWQLFLSLIPRFGVVTLGLVLVLGAMYIFANQTDIKVVE